MIQKKRVIPDAHYILYTCLPTSTINILVTGRSTADQLKVDFNMQKQKDYAGVNKGFFFFQTKKNFKYE